jgi:hypothetical protein
MGLYHALFQRIILPVSLDLQGELFFDPMAPLDFGGIDLNTISGFPDDSEGIY